MVPPECRLPPHKAKSNPTDSRFGVVRVRCIDCFHYRVATMKGRSFAHLLSLSCLILTSGSAASEEKSPEPENETVAAPPATSSSDNETPKSQQPDFDPSNTNWGSYYDPQNVFCGKFDCYRILGFDYEAFGKVPPDTRDITKRYRALSREWHPDKSKHRDAKERFVKIVRAYEVLTSKELRTEYDAMRYDQERYYNKYGTSVLWNYAPKSDVSIVILIILIAGNIFSWYSQKHRWQLVADRLILAALEDWTPSQGGTPESKQLREEAMVILAEREKGVNGELKEPPPKVPVSSKKTKGTKKVTGKEKKRQEKDQLRPIISEIVNAMDDFGGGFHKPTWRDLLIVSLIRMPITVGKELVWFTKYSIRRAQGKELNDEEKLVLTQRAVGPVTWDTASDEGRQQMIARELWVVSNLAEWSDEQEFNKLSASEKKEYLRLKKKGLLPDKEE